MWYAFAAMTEAETSEASVNSLRLERCALRRRQAATEDTRLVLE